MDPVHFSIQTRQWSKNTWWSSRWFECYWSAMTGGACSSGDVTAVVRKMARRCVSAQQPQYTLMWKGRRDIKKKKNNKQEERSKAKPVIWESVYAGRWVSSKQCGAMGSAADEEFKEKLLWNVKREVSESDFCEWAAIYPDWWTRKTGASVSQCSRLSLIHCVYCIIALWHSSHNICSWVVVLCIHDMLWEVWDNCDVIMHRPDFLSTITCWMMISLSSFLFTPLQFKGSSLEEK